MPYVPISPIVEILLLYQRL